MQEEMIGEIESANPKFLVFVNVPTSWLVRPDSERIIYEWFKQYAQRYYRQVGIIDIISHEVTVYRWYQECEGYRPRSKYWVAVFERNRPAP